ncbi:MAG: sigma-54-dependent Fis family transcriptional regulator [Nitrospirota bacterium]|nr:sigma-54-dependent Fis family transcriptional regulator [Nitrospirota bacterium]
MSGEARILVAEDDAAARELLVEALKKEGYDVEAVVGGKEAIERGRQRQFDLVLTDIRMGDVSGFEVLQAFQASSPDTPIVLLTAFGSMEGAIEAMKQGAYDYLAKPFRREDVKLVVRRSLDHRRLIRENAKFREELRDRDSRSPLVGSSPPMLEVYKLVAKVAAGKSTVLIEGESGTGKELVARAIHSNSARRDGPFVPVNCAALPESLLESELFGHERGAFTGAVGAKPGLFEMANGGTLFLDEIGDISPALQVKLLRVLQEQEVRRVGGTAVVRLDCRLVGATNQDLATLVKEGRFREDLFYRLNVVRIPLPPLRQRREDIPMLAHHFLQQCAGGQPHPIRGFLPETMACLQQYAWPGNVREIENVIERVVSLSRGPLVLPSDLPEAIRQAQSGSTAGTGGHAPGESGAWLTLEEMEKQYLQRVLQETRGNKVQAAKILGIDRRTLYRMAERFGLDLGEGSGD